jgi:hypothetical protein
MAYYIFLNSLRSLEEFRKNPHLKIPPKSPSTNFQSLGKFKNLIFNSEILFLTFGPADLVAHSAFGPASPLASLPPQAETTMVGPPGPCVGRVFTEVRFPLWFTSSELVASLSSLCQVGPSYQFHLPPAPATPRRPTSDLDIPGEVFTPRLDSPP